MSATRDEVARLFGRACFGATKADLDTWTGTPYEQVVDSLFPPATRVPEPDEARRVQLEDATSDRLAPQRWWLERMRTAQYPLEERMTLFWHTHFPTAYAGDPNMGDLMVQNQTLRRNALGSFRTMLEELTVDVAMLFWLSGRMSRVGFVNENYARELFELFAAGTIPQLYDETDVRQAAKALTGWQVSAERTATFTQSRHDRSVKTVYGRQICGYPANDPRHAVEYQEVVDVALSLPTTARYVARELVASFGYIPQTTNLLADEDPLVTAVAAAFGPTWDIEAAVRTLLMHEGFRNAPAGGLVRSPVELVVHTAKVMALDCDPPGALTDTKAGQYNRPITALRRMGQLHFEPPNVGGWPRGRRWLSSTTTLGRYSAAHYLTLAYDQQNGPTLHPLPASGDLAAWTAFAGLGSLAPLTLQTLQAYLASPATSTERTKQNSVLLLLLSSPQWQVM